MEIKCIESAARLLNIDCVNKGGLDLSKEVLWISVGQRAASSPKSLVALLTHFISIQIDLISIGLM